MLEFVPFKGGRNSGIDSHDFMFAFLSLIRPVMTVVSSNIKLSIM